MDIKELLGLYESYMVNTKRRSENTVRGYMTDLRQFIEVVKNPIEAKRSDILDYVNNFGEDTSASTIQRKVSSIQSLYKFMEEREILKDNIALKIPTPSIRKKKFNCPETETIEEIIAKEPLESVKIGLQLGGFVGLRISETCNLKVEDINFEKSIATLYNTKTAEEDEVMIDGETLANIKAYMADNNIKSGALLRTEKGKPWKERNLHKYLQGKFDFTYHALRHHCASKLANEYGVATAKTQLRHSNVQTTMGYIHPNRRLQLNALDGIRRKI